MWTALRFKALWDLRAVRAAYTGSRDGRRFARALLYLKSRAARARREP